MSEQTINPELTQSSEANNFGEVDFDNLYRMAGKIADKNKLDVIDVRAEVEAAQATEPSFRTEKEANEHGLRYVIQVGKILAQNRELHAPEVR